jgi:hypothetical protein
MGSGYSDMYDYDDFSDGETEVGSTGFAHPSIPSVNEVPSVPVEAPVETPVETPVEAPVEAPVEKKFIRAEPPAVPVAPDAPDAPANYHDATCDYFETNAYYLNPLKEEVKLDSSGYADRFHNILEKCRFVNARTFKADLEEVIELVKDANAPPEMRLVLAEWLYRKIHIFYRAKKKDIPPICDTLFAPIKACNNIVLKGLYIHYHNDYAIRYLCEHFFLHRHSERFFILQMLNDVQLIQSVPHNEILEHFLKWIRKSKNYDQQCNLLDVLLRHFPKNEEVKEIHRKMMYGDAKGKLVDLYQNDQNAHDEDITEETMKAAVTLLMWYKENKFDTEPEQGKYFEDTTQLDMALEVLKRYGEIRHLDEILVRARIDNTLFEGGFSIMQLFIALCRYIEMSPHSKELVSRLQEEFAEMNGLCSSGYINRFINTLQGFDERYSVKIPFKKQLQSSLCHHINLALQKASEEVIAGSYDPRYQREYLEFIVLHTNKNFHRMVEQYGQKDVDENIVYAMEELTGIPKLWSYEGGKVIVSIPVREQENDDDSD